MSQPEQGDAGRRMTDMLWHGFQPGPDGQVLFFQRLVACANDESDAMRSAVLAAAGGALPTGCGGEGVSTTAKG